MVPYLSARIMNLTQFLQDLLQKEHSIPFIQFMQMALYHPQYGYYSGSLPKLGQSGDFTTAPELSPLFAQTLANQCQQVLMHLHKPVILEFGAGSGRLCIELLKRLEFLDALPSTYFILEVSGYLRAQQQALIQAQIPHLAPRIEWLSAWPSEKLTGIFLANEVLDAMPVHRFIKTPSEILESYIHLNDAQEIVESFKPTADANLIRYVKEAFPSVDTPYLSEANLFIDDWILQCSDCLAQGMLLIIDYGFPRHEYYHPERRQGTLMCHYRHQAHDQFLLHLGEQDITAHVDFTHVATAGIDAGFELGGYTSQAAFLLANGLLSLLESVSNEQQRLAEVHAVKWLTDPSQMGELFKVMALTKQLDLSLQGFQLMDKRGSL